MGSITMGSYGPSENYLRNHYVIRVQNRDSMVVNPNPKEQVFSGYQQLNMLYKVQFRLGTTALLSYSLYLSQLGEVPRYDRLIQYRDDVLRYAEWYYGQQNWLMNALSYSNQMTTALYSKMNVTASWQKYNESRHSRRFGNNNRLNQFEEVDMWSLNADFDKQLGSFELFYGLECYFNDVKSFANNQNILTTVETPAASRYPDGKNHYYSSGLYANLQYILSENTSLTAGARYSYVGLDSRIDQNYLNLPVTKFTLSTGAFTTAIGATHRVERTNSRFALNFGTGYRAPNIDDIGKVFDSEPGRVVIPNSGLRPENAYNIDFSYDQEFFSRIKTKINAFYTYADNIMVRREGQLNGSDSIVYDGEMSRVLMETNAAHARIYGASFQLQAQLVDGLLFKQYFTIMDGKDSDGMPMRHVTPAFGSSHLEWQYININSGLFLLYSAALPYSKMNDSERSKPEMYSIDSDGNPYSPGWVTLNLRVQFTINKYLTTTLGVDNIADKRYRPYSSGIVAGGRNFMVSAKVSF